jgi:hypothetical protein
MYCTSSSSRSAPQSSTSDPSSASVTRAVVSLRKPEQTVFSGRRNGNAHNSRNKCALIASFVSIALVNAVVWVGLVYVPHHRIQHQPAAVIVLSFSLVDFVSILLYKLRKSQLCQFQFKQSNQNSSWLPQPNQCPLLVK